MYMGMILKEAGSYIDDFGTPHVYGDDSQLTNTL